MQSKEEIIKHLKSLASLDIDAFHAYGQAIEKISVTSVKDQLLIFQDQHRQHAEGLSMAIRSLGGEPPAFEKDWKGFLIEGFTSLRSMTGTEGALKAMHSNEMITNKKYEQASHWELPADIHDLIVKYREDERKHLSYVDEMIQSHVWESGKAA